MQVTLYKRPNGRTEDITITNVRPEDAAWFQEHNVRVSLEDNGFDFTFYADCGFRVNDDPEEDPDEIIVFAAGRSCEDTLTALRESCEEALTERTPPNPTLPPNWSPSWPKWW